MELEMEESKESRSEAAALGDDSGTTTSADGVDGVEGDKADDGDARARTSMVPPSKKKRKISLPKQGEKAFAIEGSYHEVRSLS